MALVARMAASGAANALASARFMAGGHVAPAGDSARVEEPHFKNPIDDDNASFRQGEFRAADEYYQGRHFRRRDGVREHRDPYAFSSLISNSTHSFAEAFATKVGAENGGKGNFLPLSTVAAGIAVYVDNALTIAGIRTALGENLSLQT